MKFLDSGRGITTQNYVRALVLGLGVRNFSEVVYIYISAQLIDIFISIVEYSIVL